jgi:hypothetical protein
VQSGTLGVDFASKTFTTNLNLTAQGTGVQSFSQSGTLNPGTGIFLSSGSAGSGSVAGAVTLDARQAGFLFRAPIGAGTFSGATLWGR